MKKIFVLSFQIIIFLSLHLTNSAQVISENQHEGFYLRMLAGIGSAKTTMENSTYEIEFSGFSTYIRGEIGAAIADNTILFGTAGGHLLKNPDVSSGSQTVNVNNAELIYSEFGAGVTHYFMPLNAYLSLSVLGVLNRIEYGGSKGDSEIGFGFNVSIGKEWGITDDLGMGLALFYSYGKADDQSEEVKPPTLSNNILGIALSVTYN
ncbi:MAG: hypothetical protein KKA84_03205 [Bacteroidetes bacterium]|nr:hypothetical protein [Bacteroidota bacterium]